MPLLAAKQSQKKAVLKHKFTKELFHFADIKRNYEIVISDYKHRIRHRFNKWYYNLLSCDVVYLVGGIRAFHGMLKMGAGDSSGTFLPGTGFHGDIASRKHSK